MKVKLYKSNVSGTVLVPSSKSYAHRYLLASMLANNSSKISNVYISNDIKATLNCMSSFGCNYSINNDVIDIKTLNKVTNNPVFDCNESGSTLRFLIPIALANFDNVTFKGSKTLIARGIEEYEKIFEKINIKVDKGEDYINFTGKLKPGVYEIDGSKSSQYITGLLFALPLLKDDSIINVIPPCNSINYINITLDVLKKYNIHIEKEGLTYKIKGNQKYIAKDYEVESDYSSAAFLDAFNHLNNKVTLLGLNPYSLQGDKVYLDYFAKIDEGYVTLDVSNAIDLAPVLMSLMAIKHGGVLTGTNRLKIKESDRAKAMQIELAKINVNVEIFDDYLIVHKCDICRQNVIFDSHNDHRIAMALSLFAALFDISIDNYQAVNKSYPTYFETLAKLGVVVEYEK